MNKHRPLTSRLAALFILLAGASMAYANTPAQAPKADPIKGEAAFTANAFYIFLLRQFMRGIPTELSEAAKIDRASELRTWWSIILPLSKPALAAIAIFAFQGAWQDFMGPLIYLQSERLYTLQIGLRQYEFAFGGSPAWNWLMAASLIVMLPVLLVFLAFQRYFIEGVTITGMGGR